MPEVIRGGKTRQASSENEVHNGEIEGIKRITSLGR
jgi:hypothetical protein